MAWVCCGGWWYVSGVVVAWVVFVGGLGGIATIGAALRRVAGVSGVYGRKTPRVVAQSAVHLGGMWVTWGVWGVVDDGLGCSGRRFGRGGWVDGGVVAGGMSLVSLWRGSSSTCLRVFVVVVWLVFVGGLGGIATIGAALRRVVGVSVVYGRKTPRVLARKGQGRVLFRWQCWSCSACLHLFVVVVWLVFVGGLGGIATIGAGVVRKLLTVCLCGCCPGRLV